MTSCNGKVHQVQVKVIQMELLQAVLACLQHMPMVRIPQLKQRRIKLEIILCRSFIWETDKLEASIFLVNCPRLPQFITHS